MDTRMLCIVISLRVNVKSTHLLYLYFSIQNEENLHAVHFPFSRYAMPL